MSTAPRIIALLAVACSFAACERIAVEGRATNTRGEPLPGVVVRLTGGDKQDLTGGLGRYRLSANRNAQSARLEFSKSGYAPAELTVPLTGRLQVSAPDVVLWQLPQNSGVFAVENDRFVQTDWGLPKQYYLKDGSTAYGAELPATLRATTDGAAPYILCYRTPRYNAKVSRLAPAEATVPGPDAESVQIWVESGTVAAGLTPVDLPEGNLLRIAVDRPLEPGIYGVHWGAAEGYTTLDNRVFVFRVVEPPEPDSPPQDPAAPTGDSVSEPTTDAGKDEVSPDPAPSPADKPAPVSTPPAQPEAIEPPLEDALPPQR